MCEGPLPFWQTTIQIHRPECNHFAFLNVLHFHISDLGRKKVAYHVLNFTFLKQVGRKDETQCMTVCHPSVWGDKRYDYFIHVSEARYIFSFTPFYFLHWR